MTETEIAPRLVKHLNPDVLEQHGGKYTCPPKHRVRRPGYFIILSVSAQVARLLPVGSQPGIDRVLLRPSDRAGDAQWKLPDAYWHPGQVWTASLTAVVAAAKAGNDDGIRRGITADALRAIEEILKRAA